MRDQVPPVPSCLPNRERALCIGIRRNIHETGYFEISILMFDLGKYVHRSAYIRCRGPVRL